MSITTEEIIEYITSKDKEIALLKQQYEAEQLLQTRLRERFEAQVRLTKKREEIISQLQSVISQYEVRYGKFY